MGIRWREIFTGWAPLTDWWNKDVKGALIALALFIAIGVGSCTLIGCSGTRLLWDYEHHSSVPDYRDRNTTDHMGPCLEMRANENRYAPTMQVCVHAELSGASTYGDKPTGTVRIQQPIWVK